MEEKYTGVDYVTRGNCKEWRGAFEKDMELLRNEITNIRRCIDDKLNRITSVLFTILGGLVISLIILALNLMSNLLGQHNIGVKP